MCIYRSRGREIQRQQQEGKPTEWTEKDGGRFRKMKVPQKIGERKGKKKESGCI